MQLEKFTFQYLSDLRENNNRPWYNAHKEPFKKAQTNAKGVYENIMKLLKRHDEIDTFKLFRIYRDVRFSKDKTPYNAHFAGSFSRSGKERRGGYYLRIKPGASFLAGGFWGPDKDDLFRIRKEFEYDDSEIRSILKTEAFKKVFGGKLEGNELKTAPKGFSKEHPAIDLIRKKGFIAVRKLSDQEVLSENFMELVNTSFQALRPYFNYMSEVLTTNLNGESIIE